MNFVDTIDCRPLKKKRERNIKLLAGGILTGC